MRVWTIESDLNWYKGKYGTVKAPVGALIQTRAGQYTGGDDKDGPIECRVVGYELRKCDGDNEVIGTEYTHRELYKVRYCLTGEENVMWPDEIEVINE